MAGNFLNPAQVSCFPKDQTADRSRSWSADRAQNQTHCAYLSSSMSNVTEAEPTGPCAPPPTTQGPAAKNLAFDTGFSRGESDQTQMAGMGSFRPQDGQSAIGHF
jgi:hypothetical protein